ncbi:LOW QUALITY PROTEIN: hypothetical protein CVT26_009309, partial [Gymnopilus dilepis]
PYIKAWGVTLPQSKIDVQPKPHARTHKRPSLTKWKREVCTGRIPQNRLLLGWFKGTPLPEGAEATSLHDAEGKRRSYQPAASHPQTSFTLRPQRLGGPQQPLPRFCPSAFTSCTKLLTHPQRFTTENQNGLIPGKPLQRRLILRASKSHHHG